MTTPQALALLHLQPPSFAGCSTLADHQAVLNQWRKGPLRNAYRAQARVHHPDRGTSAQQDQRTARMAQVNSAHKHLDELRVYARQPVVPSVRFGTHSTGTTTINAGAGTSVYSRWVRHSTG